MREASLGHDDVQGAPPTSVGCNSCRSDRWWCWRPWRGTHGAQKSPSASGEGLEEIWRRRGCRCNELQILPTAVAGEEEDDGESGKGNTRHVQ